MTFSAPALYISIAAKVSYFAPWFPFWELCPQNSFFMACIIDGSFFYARRKCRNYSELVFFSTFYVSDMSEMLFLCVSFVSKCFLLCSVCSDSLFYGSVNSVFSLFVHCSQLAPPPSGCCLYAVCVWFPRSRSLFYVGKMIAGNSPVFIPLNVVFSLVGLLSLSCWTFVPVSSSNIKNVVLFFFLPVFPSFL